jgi:hypothetical protein
MTAQPRGWGTDELSKFLVGCTTNTESSFRSGPRWQC